MNYLEKLIDKIIANIPIEKWIMVYVGGRYKYELKYNSGDKVEIQIFHDTITGEPCVDKIKINKAELIVYYDEIEEKIFNYFDIGPTKSLEDEENDLTKGFMERNGLDDK